MTPCPHCSRPVQADAAFCPECGFRIRHGAPAAGRGRGMKWLLTGLLMCGIAGFVFFFSCLGAFAAMNQPNRSGALVEFLFPASIFLGMAGLVVFGVGVVLSIVEAVRR